MKMRKIGVDHNISQSFSTSKIGRHMPSFVRPSHVLVRHRLFVGS